MKQASMKPNSDGTFDIEFEDPESPMEWQGGIIEPRDGKWMWTIYCGFTDKTGNPRSFRLPSLFWANIPQDQLMTATVEDAAGQLLECWHNPCNALLKAFDEAR